MRWKLRAIAATAVFVLSLAPTAAHAQQYPPQDCPGSSQGHGNAGGADDCPGNGQGNGNGHGNGEGNGNGQGNGNGHGDDTSVNAAGGPSDDGQVLGESATHGHDDDPAGGLAFTGVEIAGIGALALVSLAIGMVLVIG